MNICILVAEAPRYLYQLGSQIPAARLSTSKEEIRRSFYVESDQPKRKDLKILTWEVPHLLTQTINSIKTFIADKPPTQSLRVSNQHCIVLFLNVSRQPRIGYQTFERSHYHVRHLEHLELKTGEYKWGEN